MTEQLFRLLKQPVTIQNKKITPCIVLAPMAGLGHIAFRKLVAQFGGFGLLFTGMCSARAVPSENPDISHVFSWAEKELPTLVCQLFGPDPESMSLAARRVEAEGFFGVDLNFGCSVAAICKKGCGAALLKDPKQCTRIVSAVRKAVSIPLFVKFRTGWNNDARFAADMAKRFEDAGADALTFHPRVAPDRRSRPPQWQIIRQVQDAVDIPVFGNGNLFRPDDGIRMFYQTGCKGLSVGRMAVARPWLFDQWSNAGRYDNSIFQTAARRYIQILSDCFDPFFALKYFKKWLPYYCANFQFGHQILKRLASSKSMAGALQNLDAVFESEPAILSVPNQNLFL